jgi:hypothetical protein
VKLDWLPYGINCFSFYLRHTQVSYFGFRGLFIPYGKFRISSQRPAIGFVFYLGEVADVAGYAVLCCYQRAYANLMPMQIGFVLHFLTTHRSVTASSQMDGDGQYHWKLNI